MCKVFITQTQVDTSGGLGKGSGNSTAAFHARVRGSFPGLGGLKETQMFLPHPLVKLSSVGSFGDREVACSAPDLMCLEGGVISLISPSA